MNSEEVKILINDPDIVLPISIVSVSSKGDKLSLNNKIAISIEKHSSFFKTGLDISIFDKGGIEIGALIFTSELGEISTSSLTEDQFIAYLTEVNLSEFGSKYRFSKSYVVIQEQHYDEYLSKYAKYSSLWGGFYHFDSSIQTSSYSIAVPKITAYEVKFETDIFLENSMRAVAQPFAFERFLKFYHLLELLFDFEVIKKIKQLNVATDPEKIGELLNDYSGKEIKRLEHILDTYCNDIAPIVSCLKKAAPFAHLAYDLFYKFGTGKEGNPFNGQESRLVNVITTGFDEANLRTLKINFGENYRKFILKVASYFIYRTRSSVAHNKIGEYILAMSNESFIVEFAEPLLKEILIQCFKK